VTRSEYERLKAAAKARYDADLLAIERVWNLSSGNRVATPKTHRVTPVPAPSTPDKPQERTQASPDIRNVVPEVATPVIVDPPKRKRGSVHEIVRQVIDQHLNGGVFSSTLVSAKVKEHFDPDINRSSVSGALDRLAELGVLKVVQEGIGRRPTSYRKAV
jgi:hypothetical protein